MSQCLYQKPLSQFSINLPLVLLGPILRRAEEKQVCIWLACSRPVRAEVDIFRFTDLTAKSIPAVGAGATKSIRLGDNLHIVLAIARPSSLFPTDELLAYDIKITELESGKSWNLGDLGLTSGQNSIAYNSKFDGTSPLPTFYLRGENSKLTFLHGSCRKLHGKGEDCLAASDGLIHASFNDLNNRPSVLFLTGDQIYADDVAGPLSHYLTLLGARLLGWQEQISGFPNLSDLEIGERQELAKKYARFTSGEADNHLFSFGEFAAMYLLAWNADNWPLKFPDASLVPKKHRSKYQDQIKQLEITRKELPSVRRVLANTPTYMIFDDHDISDDWNITKAWYDNVRGSEGGRQIVANGLLAYWAFQGWGNNPSDFSDDFIAIIINHLSKNGLVEKPEKDSFEDLLWDIEWTYRAPVKPLAVVTDCRTHRFYDSYDGPPQLLSTVGFASILKAAQDGNYQKGDPIILVVPTPVFGFLLLEALQRVAARLTSVYKLDLETWFANERGPVNLLGFLMKELEPAHCTFLSGDVHYGFTANAAFALLEREEENYLHMSIVQLTSSALKTTSIVKIAFVSEIMGRIRQLFPWKQVVGIGWVDSDIDSVNKLSAKSLRVKTRPTRHLDVRPRKEARDLAKYRPPDWIEARTIVKPAGSIMTPLLISDNNIGLVTVEDGMIIQDFVTRREVNKKTKLYKTLVKVNGGRSRLDDLIVLKMREFASKRKAEWPLDSQAS